MSKKRRPVKSPEKQHVVLPEVPVTRVQEPRPLCSICGEPIEAIIEAISEPDNKYSHFDCVIKTLTEKYNVKDPDKISYLGSGAFGIISPSEDGKFIIKEKINYESNEAFSSMKKFVESTKQ